jgi:hypothetical protein
MTVAIDNAGATPAASNAADRAADKTMLHLLPWLLLMYIFAYLDRANLGFAKNAFQASTGISEAAYAFGAGIFSIAYASIEIPSNIMLRRFGACMARPHHDHLGHRLGLHDVRQQRRVILHRARAARRR